MKRRRKGNVVEQAWEGFAAQVLPEVPGLNQAEEMRMAFTAGWFAGLTALHEAKLRSGRPMLREWQSAFHEAEEAMHVEVAALALRSGPKGGGV